MQIADQVQWLRQYTQFSELPDRVLEAIAQAIEPQIVQENRSLVLEDTVPTALYILKSGHLESYRTSLTGPVQATSLLPGSILHLKELLLDQVVSQTVITLSDCELWIIPADRFAALAEQYPDISRSVSRQLAAQLEAVAAQLAFEQERQTALRPYLVPRARRGIVGSSRYAVRLRSDIKKATGDRQPVLIFGEPGLEKDNVAALIHFSGRDRKQPLIKVNCDTLQPTGLELFGRAGGKPGLLEWVGNGTVLLNNIQDLPKELEPKLLHLLTTGEYTPVNREGDPPPPPRQTTARLVMTTERTMPDLDRRDLVRHLIKVPPLRVRKADIETQVRYYINLYCSTRQLTKPDVAPEAIRRLQGYDFPGNLAELENLVARAIAQSTGSEVLTEEVFWSVASKTRRFRFNVLNGYPKLRQWLRSPWYPDRINYGFTLVAFAVVIALLFLGPQSRDRNIALNLFWDWWWFGILLIFPFLGRIWCAFCPFMIYGELAQTLSLKLYPRKLLPWPRVEAERWGAWFLFGLFALILLWEELWNLENTAYLSGWLLLLITAGAVIFSLLFERRFWCRYLCPIGGMNGLFAKLAMIELRAQQGICSATCTTYQCYKGGPEKGEGMETGGCPVYSHPAQLEDNRDCVLCMTCLKACPHRSVELNLRPPAIELWTTHTPTLAEVCLLFLLLGAVLLHRLPEMAGQFGWDLHLDRMNSHTVVSSLALLLPGAIALLAHGLTHLLNRRLKPRPFVELAYGYLPLVLGGNLAHFTRLGLGEAGRAIPVTLATFGYSTAGMPYLVADPIIIAFLQGVTLIASVWLSVFLIQKISRQPLWNVLPHHLAIAAIGSCFWKIIVGW